MRVLASIALVGALALSACGGSSSKRSTAARSSGAAPPSQLVATLTTPGPHPKVNANWPITVTARDRAGHPVHAHVQYEFLFGGAVVARRSNYAFVGVFHDTINWPPDSAGRPLTFRALVSSPIGKKALDYPVQVAR